MTLDFQKVREQVIQLGENAPRREKILSDLRAEARSLLQANARDLDRLLQKVKLAAHNYDPSLRCALPVKEPLDAHFALPALPESATILAADGSQILPDRHLEVEYCLINVGAIQLRSGRAEPPRTTITSRLIYDEQLFTPGGRITDASLALMRDLNERSLLAELAASAPAPVITFTDGPMELWGARDASGESASEFQKSLQAYLGVLSQLNEKGAITAGYVDKPAADLVVRLLELCKLPEPELVDIRRLHPLRGVTDIDLFHRLLGPGERSAVFALQSQAAEQYHGALALHFFYLNVGRPNHPWLARVDIPAWVADSPNMLDDLQAVLVSQCRLMGNRPYPYILHRAHEAAVVTLEEKEQVTQMIAQELRRRGVAVGQQSNKQFAKGLAGRTRYAR